MTVQASRRPHNPPPIVPLSPDAQRAQDDAVRALLVEFEHLADSRREAATGVVQDKAGAIRVWWRPPSGELRIDVLRANHARAHGLVLPPPQRPYDFV